MYINKAKKIVLKIGSSNLVDKQGIPNHIYEKKDDPISIEDDIVRFSDIYGRD